MDGLTKRQIIALEILKQHKYLISDNRADEQHDLIQNALDFADYFIDLSEDENITPKEKQ